MNSNQTKENQTAMHVEIETITPSTAKLWLQNNNGHNRVIRNKHVEALAADMESGRWISNGATISFDESGVLLDGQHRLAACVLSGLSFRSLVVRGLPLESQRTMDTGAKRSFSDVLHLEFGAPNAKTVSAVTRRAFTFQANDGQITQLVNKLGRSQSQRPPTVSELLSFYETHRASLQSATSLLKNARSPLDSACALPLFAGYNAGLVNEVETFSDVCLHGAQRFHPVHAFRERLLRQSKSSRLSPSAKTKLSIMAWNHFMQGNSVSQLPLRDTSGRHFRIQGVSGETIFPFAPDHLSATGDVL